jgi:large subunit ribosomal protein L4
MKVKLINQKGKELEKQVELEPTVFEAKVNDALEVQALRVYSYNQRGWNAKAKTRSEVRGGGRKPFAQKGTGRARQGSTRSPLMVGGSVVFGPRPKDKKLSMSKKMTKAAIRSALSRKVKETALRVMDKLEVGEKASTKEMLDVRKSILPDNAANKSLKLVLVIGEGNMNLKKSVSNLKNVKVLLPEAINIYELSNSDMVVLTQQALDEVTKVWKVRTKNESK